MRVSCVMCSVWGSLLSWTHHSTVLFNFCSSSFHRMSCSILLAKRSVVLLKGGKEEEEEEG